MACQVLLEFRVKDGCHDKLKQHFKQILPDTRDYEGCISLYMIQDVENPSQIMVVEQWETRQQYEKYLAWRTERGDVEVLESMWESPTWRFFDFWGV